MLSRLYGVLYYLLSFSLSLKEMKDKDCSTWTYVEANAQFVAFCTQMEVQRYIFYPHTHTYAYNYMYIHLAMCSQLQSNCIPKKLC